MSNELKPCPFCGNQPKLWKGKNDDGRDVFSVWCDSDDCFVDAQTLTCLSARAAIELWDTRYERTCHARPYAAADELRRDGFRFMSCDACYFGWFEDAPMPSFDYCPHCGAKVVSE